MSLLWLLFSSFSIVCVCCSNAVSSKVSKSPCSYRTDTRYGGVYVDCQGQGLTQLPLLQWIPKNTTSLILDHNAISRLTKDAFRESVELRFLSLNHNNLEQIDPDALRRNINLEILDLSSNRIRLDNASFTGSWTRHLGNLLDLRLIWNGNMHLSCLQDHALYPIDLLAGLGRLNALSLDTFTGALDFNGIFQNTPNLTSLVIAGGLISIGNETFREVADLNLTTLLIQDADQLKTVAPNAFIYLPHLRSYSVFTTQLGITKSLQSLLPFVNRNFTKLEFHHLTLDNSNVEAFEQDSLLTKVKSTYLSKICVKHFRLTWSNVFFIEPSVLTGPTWSRCLISLDLSDNPLLGQVTSLMQLTVLKQLQFIRLANRKYSLFDGKSRPQPYQQHYHQTNRLCVDESSPHSTGLCLNKGNNFFNREKNNLKNKTNDTHVHELQLSNNKSVFGKSNLGHGNYKRGTLYIFLPRNIAYVNINGFGNHALDLNRKVVVVGGGNFKELHISDTGSQRLIMRVHNVETIEILDMSKNDGSEITADFLSSFPNVRYLNMSKMSLSGVFSSTEGHTLFHIQTALLSLDLSDNGLFTLPPTMFDRLKNLQYLSLARNRFKVLSVNLNMLPNLHTLDIRSNSFLQLPRQTVIGFEGQADRTPFSVKLGGNVFACSCTNLPFLRWLQTTHLDLDDGRNYSCLAENGALTATPSMKDIPGFWRKCNGETSFLTSLILLSVITLIISLSLFCTKFKTQVTAAILQVFNRNFTLKTVRDYPVGVYIGYSDEDVNFACLPLRKFLEDDLKLTTYIHHRDLLPASDFASSLVTAIHSSWRIVLVMTPSYMLDQWSHLAIKSAVYSVDVSNPGRLVIIRPHQSEDSDIPGDVLTAVREECIVRMSTDEDRLHGEEKQLLTNAIFGT